MTDPLSPPATKQSAPAGDRNGAAFPQDWREALLLLLTTRASLVRIEAAEALGAARKRLVLVALLGVCAFFCWALVLAGGIAALAAGIGCAWHWVALGAALLHLLVAIALFMRMKQPLPPAFETTMAEFRKDREWILKL